MSLRNSSTEGTVFDSVSKRASHIIPSRVPHGVVVCIDQPMRTCSLRQSGTLAPTPDSESTASFTDKMGGTMDRRRDRTNPPDRLLSPCTRQSRVQVSTCPDLRPSPSVVHRPTMSHLPAHPVNAIPNLNVQPPPTSQSFQAPPTNTSCPPAVSQTVPTAPPPGAPPAPAPNP